MLEFKPSGLPSGVTSPTHNACIHSRLVAKWGCRQWRCPALGAENRGFEGSAAVLVFMTKMPRCKALMYREMHRETQPLL